MGGIALVADQGECDVCPTFDWQWIVLGGSEA